MDLRKTIGASTLVLTRGDITLENTDAIVNAANSGLLGGGGVDGAIHRAGGPQILEECRAIRANQGGCPTGEAVITTGGKLPARWVIHTVGPVWHGGNNEEDELLARAYTNSLRLVDAKELSSVAFPSISTGIYGFPIGRASRIALDTVTRFLEEHPRITEVKFVTFSQEDFDVYAALFRSLPSLKR